MRLYEVIKKPVLTEKTYSQIETLSKYTFEVARDANKTEIAQAFTKIFSVKPLAVNIINSKPQAVRTGTKFPGYSSFVKKAIITLPAGTKLNIFGDQEAAAEAEKGKAEEGKDEKGKEDKVEKNDKVAAEKPAKSAAPKAKTKPIDAAEETEPKHVAKAKTKPIDEHADKPAAKHKTKPVDEHADAKTAKNKHHEEDKE